MRGTDGLDSTLVYDCPSLLRPDPPGPFVKNPRPILGCGCVAVDDLLHVATYPAADTKTRVTRRTRRCGGLVGNALIAAARQGVPCRYVATLGDDDLSAFALESLRAEGIDVSGVARAPGASPVHSVIVVADDSGTRNILADLGGVENAPPPPLGADAAVSASVLLIDHFWPEAKLPALSAARAAGIPVVADFENRDHPRFADLLGLVDHLILSAEFSRGLTGQDPAGAVEALWDDARTLVAVTGGAEGCWYRTAQGAGHQPAFRVRAVDTNGCGDVFHGAYAAALASGSAPADALRSGAAAAALKASRPAGPHAIPRRREVEEFLQEQSQ